MLKLLFHPSQEERNNFQDWKLTKHVSYPVLGFTWRVIGLLRQKYTILESTLPINTTMCDSQTNNSVINCVVTICCALCNCCESVVPFY